MAACAVLTISRGCTETARSLRLRLVFLSELDVEQLKARIAVLERENTQLKTR